MVLLASPVTRYESRDDGSSSIFVKENLCMQANTTCAALLGQQLQVPDSLAPLDWVSHRLRDLALPLSGEGQLRKQFHM